MEIKATFHPSGLSYHYCVFLPGAHEDEYCQKEIEKHEKYLRKRKNKVWLLLTDNLQGPESALESFRIHYS